MSAVIINITDLLQLALTTKKVDYTYLLTAMQAIVYHLNLNDLKVQFKGGDSIKLQNSLISAKEEGLKDIKVNFVKEESKPSLDHSKTKADSDRKGLSYELSDESRIFIEDGKVVEQNLRRKLPAFTPQNLARLEGKVGSIQAQLDSLSVHLFPSNEAILDATRSQHDAAPVRDLFQGLNIIKRMSGAEEGIDKLASLIETMAKEYACLKVIVDNLDEHLGQNILQTLGDIQCAAEFCRKLNLLDGKKKIEKLQPLPKKPKACSADDQKAAVKVPSETASSKASNKTTAEISTLMQKMLADPKEYCEQIKTDDKPRRTDQMCSISIEDDPKLKKILREQTFLLQTLEYICSELTVQGDFIDAIIAKLDINDKKEVTEKLESFKESDSEDDNKKKSGSLKSGYSRSSRESHKMGSSVLDNRLSTLEQQYSVNIEKIKRQLLCFCSATNSITGRLNDIEKNIIALFKNIQIVFKFKGHTLESSNKKLMDSVVAVVKRCKQLNEDMKDIKAVIRTKFDKNTEEGNSLHECILQMEHLKQNKADKFEVDEYLANKADCEMLKLKVPREEFELVCNDFARGIEDALVKVATQEDLMKIILTEVQAALNDKCDQEDFDSFRDDIAKRVKTIETDLVDSKMKTDNRIAAGGKQKLSPMNCVSCDREIVMKANQEISAIPTLSDLPPSTSIQPFISYQLDQLRKMILKNPNERTIFVFEEALKRYKVKPLKRDDSEIYITGVKTRYCGGKHTTLKKPKLKCLEPRAAREVGT